MIEIPDSATRERAATATDRNIVVTAGAGTGKTTLLVKRLLYLLLRRSAPLTIDRIVALTFTNKAANELKLRLRTELGKEAANELAAKALAGLEKSQIGTIHSFAAHLLRLYPVESGVDPLFQQDEGPLFKDFFNQQWMLWLDRELGPAGTRQEVWRAALKVASLDDLNALATDLAGELIPLDRNLLTEKPGMPPPIVAWLTDLARQATVLRQAHPKTNTLERMMDAAVACLNRMADRGCDEEDRGMLERDVPGITTTWSKEEYARAKSIVEIVQSLATVQEEGLRPVLQLLAPFALECRTRFVQRGYISFDGLLARARDLLRDYPSIRRDLKHQFHAILVDEFQDTDPAQYELILYLAEADGHEARDWREVRLEPGKLFIVGDPKQSIYAFRRADMEAYDAVVEDQVLAQSPPGERYALQTNFRSHQGLLATINAFFAGVFPRESLKGLQPGYEPLVANDASSPSLASERVELRIVRPEEPEADAETASRAEAEELARWLSEEVLGREEIIEREVRTKIKPGHVVVLFRTLTGIRDYLEALRRYAIPCLAEGEKHFYERQEVMDVVNLLRTAANPHDRVALVAVLRSVLGGLPDGDLEALARGHLLDYRTIAAPASLAGDIKEAFEKAAPVYSLLRELHHRLPRLPLTEVIDSVLARAPMLELAAASMDQEQAVANLLKLRDLAAELAQRSDLTWHAFVAELTSRVSETPDETEGSLAEDSAEGSDQGQGMVRLLSIHKAKGLEFPVVVLAGLHRGTDRREPRVFVQHDWSTGILGVRVGDVQTVGGVFVGAKLAERQRYEQSRVLYVGMTRAKRRLILSAGLPKSIPPDSFLAQVARGCALDLDELGDQTDGTRIPLGEGEIFLQVVQGSPAQRESIGKHAPVWSQADDDVSELLTRWGERTRRKQEAVSSPVFTSPTALQQRMNEPVPFHGSRRARVASDVAQLVGILAHRVLESWDYRLPPEQLSERVEGLCRREIPAAFVAQADLIMTELLEVFRTFAASPPYAELRRATIVGREVPFIIPWEHTGYGVRDAGPEVVPSTALRLTPDASRPLVVMEGVIDLIYKLDGQMWVADYKTDRLRDDEVAGRVAAYSLQARVYAEAVSRYVGGEKVGFKFLFLRNGLAVQG